MIKSPLVSKLLETDKWRKEEMFVEKGRIYTFLNPVSYLIALKNIPLYSSFDGLFSDGSILVGAIWIVYFKKIWRRSFDMTSIAPRLFRYANSNMKSICIVASKQSDLDKVLTKVTADYPNIEWKVCRNGYFSSEEEIKSQIDLIIENQPDFVVVGMGAEKQEHFLIQCKERGFKGIGFTCGGFVHQYAENRYITYYPRWIDKCNLRFIYRFVMEKHTRRRYAVAAFVFPVKFIAERLKYLFS